MTTNRMRKPRCKCGHLKRWYEMTKEDERKIIMRDKDVISRVNASGHVSGQGLLPSMMLPKPSFQLTNTSKGLDSAPYSTNQRD